MALLMSQTEFARRHNVGKSAVSNWKAASLLVFADDPDRPGKMLVDAEKSDLLVRGSIDQTRGRPRASDQARAAAEPGETAEPAPYRAPAMSVTEAARHDEVLERTRSRRIENEKALGGLVSLAEYERRAADFGRRCREGVNALVRRLSERLAAETDPRQLVALVIVETDGLFDRLADELEAEAQSEREADREMAPLAEDDEELVA
jgi:hypothetical protein